MILGLFALSFYPSLRSGTLLDSISPRLTWGGAIVAGGLAVAGLIWTCRQPNFGEVRRSGDWLLILGLCAIPFFGAMLGIAYARIAVETRAFIGYEPIRTIVDAPISRIARGSRSPSKWVVVTPGPDDDELMIDINGETYDWLEATPAARKGCIRLLVETGRGGVRRTRTPGWFSRSYGKDRWVPCRAGSSPAAARDF